MPAKAHKRKAHVISAPQVAPKKVASDAPAIEREEIEGQTPAKRRLRARSTEEDVRKCERDNFSGYSHADLHHHLVGGVSLHNRLAQDVHARRQQGCEARVMGKAYYADLRSQWVSSAASLASTLAVADPTLPQDLALDSALEGVVSHRKNFTKLLEWFENGQAPNQKVVVCVAKAVVIYIKPNTNERVDVVLAHMRWVRKHKLETKFQAECDAAKQVWVAACVRSLSTYKNNGMTTNRWWSEFKDIGGLLVDQAACQKCMDHKTADWNALETELVQVVTANDFGYALFAMQAQNIFKVRLSRVASEVVEAHLVGKPITKDSIDAAKLIFDTRLGNLGASGDTTFPPRSTSVLYRGVKVSFDVVSYNDEWKAHVQALARSVGVASGILPALWGEEALAAYSAPAGTTVAAELVASSKLFRESAADLARTFSAYSGDKIKSVFDKKKRWFHSLDRYCIVERSFFLSMVGESAMTKVQEDILKALPTVTATKTLEQSCQAFKSIADSEILRFAGASAQAVFDEANALLQALRASRLPTWPGGNSSYLKDLKVAMSLFLEFKPASDEGTTIYGEAAAKAHFKHVSDLKSSAGAACQYSDLTPLIVYGWLLNAEEHKKVSQWSQQVLAAVGKTKAPGGKSSGSGSKSNGTAGESKKRGDTKDHLRKAVSQLWS